jgi:transposase
MVWSRQRIARSAAPNQADGVERHVREQLSEVPQLSGACLLSEIREQGYSESYTAVKNAVREIRPVRPFGFGNRLEASPGRQEQDFAHLRTVFEDQPDTVGWRVGDAAAAARLS